MLSVAIIVKNEEQCLAKCLESIKGVDEIIIVDTGSEDKTIEIAKKYTKNIFYYKWDDSFANARNFALSKCKGKWVLSIDADEFLNEGDLNKIYKYIDETTEDQTGLSVSMVYVGNNKFVHRVPRIFKMPCKWESDIHEYVPCNAKATDIKIFFDRSPTHDTDPDRNQRILLNSVRKNNDARSKYYLAHDYFDRGQYGLALYFYEEYIKVSTWKYEKADAYLRASMCLFNLQRGEEARDYCLKAILLNPNFKEAVKYMATLSWEKEAVVWSKFAELCDNSDVLFIRE
jgi:glycosyltransferase involved in cell wall biosynthesis